MAFPTRPWINESEKKALKGLCAVGAAALVAGVVWTPQRAWANLLLVNFYFIGLALSGAVLMGAHYLAKAGWPTLIRRIPEAMIFYLPMGALLMLVLFFGMSRIYPWAGASEAKDIVLLGKSALLNVAGFRVRAVLYLALWYFLARRMVENSRSQDSTGDVSKTESNIKLSAFFVVAYAVTFSLASIEWLMSLEPHWYSTLYPWYIFSGTFAHGIAVQTVLLLVLRNRGYFSEVNEHHLHDLGKYIFAFSVFWAYLWFCQFLLIWYSNIPEETTHYVMRMRPGWNILFLANPILNFILPFALLLSAKRKKSASYLLATGVLLILGHWLDLYLQVMPSLESSPRLGLLEIGMFLGGASVFVLVFDRAFQGANVVPLKDPYIGESLHHHG